MKIRPYQASDQKAIIDLVDSVYREYGDRLFLEGADVDLMDIDAAYTAKGGAFVVLDLAGRVCATHATLPVPDDSDVLTFRRLYLRADLRGKRLGYQMMEWALNWARERNYKRVEFWSDTRFSRAHRFFEYFGIQKDGRIREMADGWMAYREFFFFKDLPG